MKEIYSELGFGIFKFEFVFDPRRMACETTRMGRIGSVDRWREDLHFPAGKYIAHQWRSQGKRFPYCEWIRRPTTAKWQLTNCNGFFIRCHTLAGCHSAIPASVDLNCMQTLVDLNQRKINYDVKRLGTIRMRFECSTVRPCGEKLVTYSRRPVRTSHTSKIFAKYERMHYNLQEMLSLWPALYRQIVHIDLTKRRSKSKNPHRPLKAQLHKWKRHDAHGTTRTENQRFVIFDTRRGCNDKILITKPKTKICHNWIS